MWRRLIGVLIILLIAGGLFFSMNNDNMADNSNTKSSQPKKEEIKKEEKKEVPQKEISDALLKVYNVDKTTKLKLEAEKMIQLNNQSHLQLRKIKAKVFDEQKDQDKPNVTLVAAKGIYYPKEGRLEFFPPLSVMKEGLKVKADLLNWNQSKNHWQGKGNVVIIQKKKNIKLTGDSFTAYIDLDRLQVNGDTKLERLKVGDEVDF
ncbi:LPS export ABC transporter periplasmic protein LptC [Selenihalanaerobacter shriftii]|uniref:Lipopolysaccharide-assembly, LptC-related n=1 Tax=Selenihalanaerobacter shriftii TaxID=142842 RepID=A0A1T4KXT5_9FIRM|nr:LPS export ABC transporter periplasmic protein LptC [Selenihalanaerobacter shriftii]SJZ47163.1 Lipopolysaccharide-assembly, LptC-related [Selenihalanaerobacter shriftii]